MWKTILGTYIIWHTAPTCNWLVISALCLLRLYRYSLFCQAQNHMLEKYYVKDLWLTPQGHATPQLHAGKGCFTHTIPVMSSITLLRVLIIIVRVTWTSSGIKRSSMSRTDYFQL
ncbi:hypothetical protein SERLA73DRAFT_179734 [Serpula lacrymans var. lacrymans S7.3]|uniref:Uncharacterized protein n=2 Tax=Serpula lacrymans var. lacrymans TaxID=341189 RepID=F8PU04_SERL3|nr:uncharacterized protein SERLADRAFT_464988 [Serpula lacrymans var. lacrymans S7.9]EGN99629.1 hypothetical protein SERLA73DRAFT_179734 [Serpula lacrymans var. lacrymans S7.3]EGO25194.1 hypothetical protein SERLADRAFT_464988 [Serpula lacrymans var. lacrymans S7.9]